MLKDARLAKKRDTNSFVSKDDTTSKFFSGCLIIVFGTV